MKFILASTSPRRRELLEALGFAVRVLPPAVNEIEDGDPLTVAKLNAELKAHSIRERYGYFDADMIIGADTIVILHNQIFGKPANFDDARAMLEKLSGQTHQVITAFCLLAPTKNTRSAQVLSEVSFRKLTRYEIDTYIRTQECMDKAGAYAVQGAGAALIDKINGSLTNIIGLPVEELLHEAQLLINAPR